MVAIAAAEDLSADPGRIGPTHAVQNRRDRQ